MAETTSARSRPLGSFQFGISHMLAVMVGGVLLFTCIGGAYREGVARRQAETIVEELGGKLSVYTAGKPRLNQDHKTLSFVKPLDDQGLARLAPYARWLTSIREIDLTDSPMTGEGLRALAGMPHLESLLLAGTAIDDAALGELLIHPELVRLSLARTPISDAGMSTAAQLPLVALDVSKTRVGDAGLAELARLTTLDTLVLTETHVTDAGLASAEVLRRLERLDLSHTGLSDACMTSVKRLPALEWLSLAGNPKVTARSISGLEHLRALRGLDLKGTGFQPADFERLRRAMPGVELGDGVTSAPPMTPPAQAIVPLKPGFPVAPVPAQPAPVPVQPSAPGKAPSATP